MHWPTKRKQTKPHAESPETAQQPQGKPAQSGAMTCTVHMKAKKPKTGTEPKNEGARGPKRG